MSKHIAEEWRGEYYASFVTRQEAEEFRSRCYFASNFYNAVTQDPSKEFELLCNEWQAYTAKKEPHNAPTP